jgi:hypothetical protein
VRKNNTTTYFTVIAIAYNGGGICKLSFVLHCETKRQCSELSLLVRREIVI